MSNSTTIQG